MKPTGKIKTYWDENGARWIVEPGDPGYEAVQLEKELRFNEHIIPFAALMGNSVNPANWDAFKEMVDGDDFDPEILAAEFTLNRMRQELHERQQRVWQKQSSIPILP